MADAKLHRLGSNLVALLVLAALAAAFAWWQKPWSADEHPAEPAHRAVLEASELSAFFDDLSTAASMEEFADAAGRSDAAQSWARDVWAARRTLGVVRAEWAYSRGGETAEFIDGSSVARVILTWLTHDESVLGPGNRTSELAVRLSVSQAGEIEIQKVEPAHLAARNTLPMWLAGKLERDSFEGGTLLTLDGGIGEFDMKTLVQRANLLVREKLPQTRGDLMVLAPRTAVQAAEVLGRPFDEIAHVAAIATRLHSAAEKPLVVINPAVFTTMDSRAAQVVISHEAVHLLTGAVGAPMRTWVAEGFADFIALSDDRAPLEVSAGQILRKVRSSGVPKMLPADTEFAADDGGLGATYEAAWMIFRYLGEQYPVSQIFDFYQAVRDGADTEKALREHLDMSISQLTKAWRNYLKNSVSTVS